MNFLIDYLGQKLGLPELEQRVKALEVNVHDLERDFKSAAFGDYKNKTRFELKQLREDVGNLLDSVEALIQHAEDQEEIKSAKKLKQKLKLNQTKIKNALAA